MEKELPVSIPLEQGSVFRRTIFTDMGQLDLSQSL